MWWPLEQSHQQTAVTGDSMKTVDTLVTDIYDLFNNGADVSDELIDQLGKDIAETIKQNMASYKTPRKSYLRPSNLGKKARQIYYDIHDYDREELTAPTKIKFLYGHILEHLLLFFSKAAGHTVTGEQTPLSVAGLTGSRDCVIDGMTVDVKSASSFAFKKFKEGKLRDDDPFGYIPQLSYYVEGDKKTDQEEAAFLVIDKTLGHICLSKIDYMDMPNIPKKIESLQEILASGRLPEKCYEDIDEGKSGNRKLGINCSYCQFKEKCWEDSNGGKGLRKFAYSHGVTYLTHVAKEPRVQEVTE